LNQGFGRNCCLRVQGGRSDCSAALKFDTVFFLRSVGTYQPNCTVAYGRGSCYYRGNFTYYMGTNSMGRLHSWEADGSSSDQQISHTFWVSKVCCFVHRTAKLISVLSQINPFHASPPYFLEIHFNIILPSTTRPAEWPLCFRFPHQNPVCTSPLSPYVLHVSSMPLFFIRTRYVHYVHNPSH